MAEEDMQFTLLASVAKKQALKFSSEMDRVKALKWLKQIRECKSAKLRDHALQLLMLCIQRKCLVGPFIKIPDKNKPLSAYRWIYQPSDFLKLIMEKEYRRLSQPPVRFEITGDLSEFVSYQEIPYFGMHFYYAFSPETINGWSNVNDQIIPDGMFDPKIAAPLDTSELGKEILQKVQLSRKQQEENEEEKETGEEGGQERSFFEKDGSIKKKIVEQYPAVLGINTSLLKNALAQGLLPKYLFEEAKVFETEKTKEDFDVSTERVRIMQERYEGDLSKFCSEHRKYIEEGIEQELRDKKAAHQDALRKAYEDLQKELAEKEARRKEEEDIHRIAGVDIMEAIDTIAKLELDPETRELANRLKILKDKKEEYEQRLKEKLEKKDTFEDLIKDGELIVPPEMDEKDFQKLIVSFIEREDEQLIDLPLLDLDEPEFVPGAPLPFDTLMDLETNTRLTKPIVQPEKIVEKTPIDFDMFLLRDEEQKDYKKLFQQKVDAVLESYRQAKLAAEKELAMKAKFIPPKVPTPVKKPLKPKTSRTSKVSLASSDTSFTKTPKAVVSKQVLRKPTKPIKKKVTSTLGKFLAQAEAEAAARAAEAKPKDFISRGKVSGIKSVTSKVGQYIGSKEDLAKRKSAVKIFSKRVSYKNVSSKLTTRFPKQERKELEIEGLVEEEVRPPAPVDSTLELTPEEIIPPCEAPSPILIQVSPGAPTPQPTRQPTKKKSYQQDLARLQKYFAPKEGPCVWNFSSDEEEQQPKPQPKPKPKPPPQPQVKIGVERVGELTKKLQALHVLVRKDLKLLQKTVREGKEMAKQTESEEDNARTNCK